MGVGDARLVTTASRPVPQKIIATATVRAFEARRTAALCRGLIRLGTEASRCEIAAQPTVPVFMPPAVPPGDRR
jgi:hypothetical protein